MKTLFDTDEWEYVNSNGVLYRRGENGHAIKSFNGEEWQSVVTNSELDIMVSFGWLQEIRDGVQ